MATEAELKYILEQLDLASGGRPRFYLKFCSEKSFAEDVCNGDFYANTPQYFRDKELEIGISGQGDKDELKLTFKAKKIRFNDPESGESYGEIEDLEATFHYKDDNEIPLVSFVGIRLKDMIPFEDDGNEILVRLPFTETEFAEMTDKFGPYCVIFGAKELEASIEAYCKYCDIDYIFGAVNYCSGNNRDRMKAFDEHNDARFFYKNKKFEYQREYRLVVGVELPEDHFLRFGKLNSAHILNSANLSRLTVSVEYEKNEV